MYSLYGINTLDKLETHLKSSSFFRNHRNNLINLNFIKEFSPWFNGKYFVIMNDGNNTELFITRSRVKSFKQHLGI